MFKSVMFFALMCLSALTLFVSNLMGDQQGDQEVAPKYLFKILSLEDWKESQGKEFVKLSTEDRDFIHLAKEDQLDKIIDKYWSKVPDFIVLKVDAAKLPGKLILEANPGGTNKYYHLYEGSIPSSAVVEAIHKKN